ncbi:hypothetical protein PTKIN_Ptkin11bG0193200 [Pterospermum kingtungense]
MWRLYQFLCIFFFFLLHFHPNLSSSSSLTHLCSHHEATALIQFKNSFTIHEYASPYYCNIDAGIKSYPKTKLWKEGTDCCSWEGVSCDNQKGQVIGLDLSCSWLYGTIPSNSSLFHLPHLQKLNLAFNDFSSSTMSSKFGEFANLVYLNLSYSSFSGQVPSKLSHLSKLVSLDLSWNDDQTLDKHTLKGLVENLTEVRQLSFDGINMSSINPNVLMNLSSSLSSLSLHGCGLRGKLPTNVFHLPNLKFLNLRDNQNISLKLPKLNWSSHLEHLELSPLFFSKEMIDSIDNFQSLKYLHLSYTSFPGGLLPESIMNLSSLEHLAISNVNFNGGLPNSIGNLFFLKHLDLSQNFFSGGLPDSIGNLVSLIHLELYGSNLSGSISTSLGNLTQLRYLDLSSNRFSGQLPYSLTNLTQLEELDISNNSIEGSIPSWLYVASSLKSIYLYDNQLSGHIKEFRSTSLEVIHLDGNKLQGPIPSSISQLLNLTALSLGSNNLSGTFDFGMFSKLQHLQYLHISQNNPSLTCNGTDAAYKLPNLQYLTLSCNINKFPLFLKGSKDLQGLDLSNNRIDGKFPMWMQDVGNNSFFYYLNLSHNLLTDAEQTSRMTITFLDLSFNLIQGKLPIPSSLTQFFFISNNNLSGEIPSQICNSSLQFLDLSHNNLRGSIPPCFGDLSKSLSMLNLQKNKFYGIIPPTFKKGCRLSYLNLNDNQLEGPLTRSILHCRELEVLDFGNNKINDTFPHWLGSLKQLQVLILQSNRLYGPIYYTRSNPYFSKIQIFDLSSNYFTGPLPARYIKNFMVMMNLTTDKTKMSYLGLELPSIVSRSFYSYSIAIAIKGLEMELVKIVTLLMSIDLSNNKFEGEIPEDIGKLKSLEGLNLSHNNLSGCIPASIGNMSSLEWLDLSSNKLVGMIPERLVDLTFLSFFNVSENQLHGLIPQGKQFNTFGNDSYEGNNGLCGFPISKGCSNIEAPPPNLVEEDGSKSNIAFGWKAVLTGYGCGIVFGLAMGYVIFQTGKPKWFVSLVEARNHRRQKTSRNGHRSGGGRRRI